MVKVAHRRLLKVVPETGSGEGDSSKVAEGCSGGHSEGVLGSGEVVPGDKQIEN